MKYTIPAIIALIIVVGVVLVVRMLINDDRNRRELRKAQRYKKTLNELHRDALRDADIDPTSRQFAHKIADRLEE